MSEDPNQDCAVMSHQISRINFILLTKSLNVMQERRFFQICNAPGIGPRTTLLCYDRTVFTARIIYQNFVTKIVTNATART